MVIRLFFVLYPMNIIEQAISDYRDITVIKILNTTESYLDCEFKCDEKDFNIIKNEFLNYLIALYNSNKGV